MNLLIEKYGGLSNLESVDFGCNGEISLNSFYHTLSEEISEIRIKLGRGGRGGRGGKKGEYQYYANCIKFIFHKTNGKVNLYV